MKIALVQMDIAWLDIPSNLTKIRSYIEEADTAGAELVVFPEMALTGFCMAPEQATLEISSPEIKELCAMTRGKKALVAIGAAMRTRTTRGVRYTNDCLLIRNGELVSSYSKMNLFTVTDEQKHYEPGDRMITLEYEGFRITPLICFDTRFLKPFITGAARETDAFIIMASWPVEASAQWKTLLSARATDTQAFVIGVNRIGQGGGLNFAGECMVIGPSGKPMFEYSSNERMILADVDLGYARKLRGKFPVLAEQHSHKTEIPVEIRTLRT